MPGCPTQAFQYTCQLHSARPNTVPTVYQSLAARDAERNIEREHVCCVLCVVCCVLCVVCCVLCVVCCVLCVVCCVLCVVCCVLCVVCCVLCVVCCVLCVVCCVLCVVCCVDQTDKQSDYAQVSLLKISDRESD